MHPSTITSAVMKDYRKQKFPQRLENALAKNPRDRKEISFLRKEIMLLKK